MAIAENPAETQAIAAEEQAESQNPEAQGQPVEMVLLPGDKNDGNVSIRITADNLEVWGDFLPPLGEGRILKVDDISEALARLNIIYGLRWENIQEAVQAANLDRKPVKTVQLAQGDPPAKEILEYFEVNPALKKIPPKLKGNERLDYKTVSPFTIVKKGQVLAVLRPRKEGRDGKDIHGKGVSFNTIRPEGVTGGENTRSDDKFIYADINGQFIEEKNVLSVQNSLEIKGGVDYHTGNIVFPGDITIDGPVSDGFKIYSGGSVTIKQTFDVTDAVTKGDLVVSGGIIGRGRALVKVGGALTTKFIENCKCAVRNTITVDADIVNSSVYTMESIIMGEKGWILGGEIYATQGVKTGGIGKKAGRATKIHCGVDFTALQEKDKLNNGLRIVAAKLSRVNEMLAEEAAKPEPELPAAIAVKQAKIAKLEEARRRLEAERDKYTAAITAILGRINAAEDAAVEVTGEIAAGTIIEICQVALFVTDPLKKIRVRLDRSQGKIVTENL